MKQEVSNNKKNRIGYFYKVQQVAKIMKKVYFEESKQLRKVMLDLNRKETKKIIFKISKLHQQNVI